MWLLMCAAPLPIDSDVCMPLCRDVLPAVLSQGGFDWVAVTSPESAAVFIEGWNQAGQPHVSGG